MNPDWNKFVDGFCKPVTMLYISIVAIVVVIMVLWVFWLLSTLLGGNN